MLNLVYSGETSPLNSDAASNYKYIIGPHRGPLPEL